MSSDLSRSGPFPPAAGTPRVVVAGGGTAGIMVAAQLRRLEPDAAITIIDPAEFHDYQPLWTLAGGGLVRAAKSRRTMASVIPPRVRWLKKAVGTFEPDRNLVRTTDGEELTYEALVVAVGLQPEWDRVKGLREALGRGGVCSNYSFAHADYTWDCIRSFKSGTALFSFPDTPIKCAGAPQKIMYLAERHFAATGVRHAARVRFVSAIDKLFSVPKYRTALEGICRDRGIELTFKRRLTAVDADRKVAVFTDTETGATEEIEFALLHVGPPMGAPEFLKGSPLVNAAGFVEVDRGTLRHVRYANIYGLGDSSNLPTSKTGAAIRAQAPVVVENLLAGLAGRPPVAVYDGYTSCPLVTGYGELILAEFDYDLNPRETFPFDQSVPRRSMFWLKRYLLPLMYWHGMLPGWTVKTLFATLRRWLPVGGSPGSEARRRIAGNAAGRPVIGE